MAYFSFKRLNSAGSRNLEPTIDSNRSRLLTPQDVPQTNSRFVLSSKTSPALGENQTFEPQSASPSQRVHSPLNRDVSRSSIFSSHARLIQSPQFLPNSDHAKDTSGFLLPSHLSRSSNRDSSETVRCSTSPDTPANTRTRLSSAGPTVTANTAHELDDDISAIMRGATDLKNTRMQLEEQRRRVVTLSSQLDAAKEENAELICKIKAVKDAAKAGYQKSSASLAGLKTSLDTLEEQSRGWSNFVAQVKSSMPDVQDIRKIVTDTTTGIAPFLEGNGPNAQTRDLIRELQSEYHNSQQVTDILRDKLTSLGYELVDAKCRVTDLEGMQLDDKQTHKQTLNSLSAANQTVTELSVSIKEQRKELSCAISSAVELEAKLLAANQRNTELTGALEQKENVLSEMPQLRERIYRLELQLSNAEAQLSEASELRNELANLGNSLRDREIELGALRFTLAEREDNLKSIKVELSKVESQLENTHRSNEALQNELGAVGRREERALQTNIQTNSEKGMLEKQKADLESQLNEVRTDLEQSRDMVQQMKTWNQVLQERFDDQSVTLRVTKETVGDLQERIVAAETSFARDIEAVKGQFTCETTLLKEQRVNLQTKIDEYQVQLGQQDEILRQVKIEFEKRLSDHETNGRERLEGEKQRRIEVGIELIKREEIVQELKREVAMRDQEISKKDRDISKKDLEMARTNQEISKKEREISRQGEEISKKDKEASSSNLEISRMNQELSKKNQEISKKEKEVSRRDVEMTRVKQEMVQKDQEIAQKAVTIEELKRDLAGSRTTVDDTQAQQVEELTTEVQSLKVEVEKLVNRSKELNRRYLEGDLNEEEKTFITNLIRTSQSVHEQEIVSKGNEIRRRDNTIQALQSKINVLENAVTRHAIAASVPAAPEKPSMIPASAWFSSQCSSPPTNAPDRDAPSTNEEPAAVAKETTSHTPAGVQSGIAISSATRKTPGPAAVKALAKANGVSFTRLGTDDITDVEDEPPLRSTLRKRAREDKDIYGDADEEYTERGRPRRRRKISATKAAPAKQNAAAKATEAAVVHTKPRKQR